MSASERVRITPEQARSLTLDTDPWLSCDECFELVDQYVQAIADDSGVTAITQVVYGHLLGCAACNEEAQTLLSLITADREGRQARRRRRDRGQGR
ncbi:MAG: hypothetical protein ACRDYB_05975 [Acidimicrobiales bacterium]